MSIAPNFAALLGNNSNAGTKADDRPKAQVWVNVGYLITVPSETNAGETERRFVSLALGIPVDNAEPLDTRGKQSWANFQAARNQLTKDITTMGMALEPGATAYFPSEPKDGELCIELRRVGVETIPDTGAANPYLRVGLAA